jgi:hypothetical protein
MADDKPIVASVFDREAHPGEVPIYADASRTTVRWVPQAPDAWAPDNPDAVDPTKRRNIERAMKDPEYFKEHKKEILWIIGEQKRRGREEWETLRKQVATGRAGKALEAKQAEAHAKAIAAESERTSRKQAERDAVRKRWEKGVRDF